MLYKCCLLSTVSPSVSPPSSAVAVITPERSPRPTSAPAIAQSHAAEPVPAKPDAKDVVAASKAEKEPAKPDVRREEIPAEKAKPEAADASKVCQTSLEEAALVPGCSIGSGNRPGAAAALCAPSPARQRGVYSGGMRYGGLDPGEIPALTLRARGRRRSGAVGFWWSQSK